MSATDFVTAIKAPFKMVKDVVNGDFDAALTDLGNHSVLGAQYNREQDTVKQAKKNADEAVLAAKKLADEQDQAFNKANMKKPNYLGIKSNNSSFDTTLLGGGGSSAPLGKSTLLGR
jgi:hypothetical protein